MKERESERKETDDNVSNELRLNKYIANTGLCSRRAADKLIEEGRVKVNGKVNIELGTKVTLNDKVVVDGNLLSTGERFYILINYQLCLRSNNSFVQNENKLRKKLNLPL